MQAYKCPACGSTDLEVLVQCWARLVQVQGEHGSIVETVTALVQDPSHEWDGASTMVCLRCLYLDRTARFQDGKLQELTGGCGEILAVAQIATTELLLSKFVKGLGD